MTTPVWISVDEGKERPQAFITNLDIDDEIGRDRDQSTW
jgi:hypothetical protein